MGLVAWDVWSGVLPVASGLAMLLGGGWYVVYRGIAPDLEAGRLEAASWRLLAQGAVYLLWVACAGAMLVAHSAALSVFFLALAGVGYAFQCAALFPRDLAQARWMFLAFWLGTVALGAGLAAGSPSLLSSTGATYAGVGTLVALAMVIILHTHGPTVAALEDERRRGEAASVELALTRQRQAIAERTAGLLGSGASAGFLSHDLAGALTGLKMSLSLLQESGADRELVEVAEQSASRINALADDLVAALRGERSVTSSDALVAAVRRRLNAMGVTDAARPERLTSEVGAAHLEVDTLLVQAIANLVGNGLRYSPDGPVVLRLLPSNGAVRVEVRDHGTQGEARDAAMDRMRRALSSDHGVEPSEVDESHGLGLWLVGMVLERSGQRLTVSAPDDGDAGIVVSFEAPAAAAVQAS